MQSLKDLRTVVPHRIAAILGGLAMFMTACGTTPASDEPTASRTAALDTGDAEKAPADPASVNVRER